MINKNKIFTNTFLLRFGAAIIFLSHSLHGIFTGNDVNDFGNLFLNKIGLYIPAHVDPRFLFMLTHHC